MPVDMRPAIPSPLPRAVGLRPSRDRLLWWLATAVTVLSAAIAIVVAATTAVVLGIS